MRQAVETLEFATKGRGLFDITAEVRSWQAAQPITTGLLTLFCRHTSASLLIILRTIFAAAGKPDITGFLFEEGTLIQDPDEPRGQSPPPA